MSYKNAGDGIAGLLQLSFWALAVIFFIVSVLVWEMGKFVVHHIDVKIVKEKTHNE